MLAEGRLGQAPDADLDAVKATQEEFAVRGLAEAPFRQHARCKASRSFTIDDTGLTVPARRGKIFPNGYPKMVKNNSKYTTEWETRVKDC